MTWFDTFAENLKIFWNQPVPIIGFTVGMVIIGALFILAKTSIGKKALNKLKQLYYDLKARYEVALEVIKDTRREFEEFKEEKEKQIVELTDAYELKWNQYKGFVEKQDKMIKVICENSPNVKIKKAYEEYSQIPLDLPFNETVERIKEETRKEYEDRIAALEELVYGKKEERTNSQARGE